VKYIIFGTKEGLSHSIGKENKAIIALKDKNFSDSILKLINN
jgi:ribosomal protein L7Ae-like RNA K-turn-binding protein